MTSPFAFTRGIRQGCPLSGSLYAICIEPLLNYIRNNKNIRGFSPNNREHNKLSGYADDVDVMITRNSEFAHVTHCLRLYERASSAKVNLSKSQGLWCGSWMHRTDKPLGLDWNNQGLKFLGVLLGNDTHFELGNWTDIFKNVKTKINKWKPLFPFLSLKGRVLVINSLAASKLWHKMHIICPPQNIVKELQSFLVNSLWLGKRHWVKTDILCSTRMTGTRPSRHRY